MSKTLMTADHRCTDDRLPVPAPAVRVRSRASGGFSLLELTLVLVIIGLLSTVAAINLIGGSERASIRATKATLNTYKTQINAYRADNAGNLPMDLQTLVTAKYVEGVGNAQLPPDDAWDEQLYYNPQPDAAGNPYSLTSAGPDKIMGTPDDISVWATDEQQ